MELKDITRRLLMSQRVLDTKSRDMFLLHLDLLKYRMMREQGMGINYSIIHRIINRRAPEAVAKGKGSKVDRRAGVIRCEITGYPLGACPPSCGCWN